MVATAKGKVYKYDNRHYLYLPIGLIKDSSFPFDLLKDVFQIRIDGKRVIVEKA